MRVLYQDPHVLQAQTSNDLFIQATMCFGVSSYRISPRKPARFPSCACVVVELQRAKKKKDSRKLSNFTCAEESPFVVREPHP